MLGMLQTLGITPSFSRPRCSNDNPYSESIFKTLKYRPSYPHRAFDSLKEARQWVTTFVKWYNHEHRHSAIGFVTPGERHAGLDGAILSRRIDLYEAAKERHPERWSRAIRKWKRVEIVHLNPDQQIADKEPSRVIKKAA